jgi:hypothetical protein
MAHPPDRFLLSITQIEPRDEALADEALADEALAFARMSRKNGFTGWILLGWWKSKPLRQSTRLQLKDAGCDYVTHRMNAMDRVLRLAVNSSDADDAPTIPEALVAVSAV